MSFRFQRRIKLFPGVSLNIGKKGASVSLGPRGFRTTLSSRGVKHSVGLPGTGLRYETPYSANRQNNPPQNSIVPQHHIVLGKHAHRSKKPLKRGSLCGKRFQLEYHYPQNKGLSAFPKEASSICNAVIGGMRLRKISSIFLFLSIIGLATFFISWDIGIIAFCTFALAISFKVAAYYFASVKLEYVMDSDWLDFANERMKPFTYLSQTKCLWEVTGSSVGNDKKYNAGCSTVVSRSSASIEKTAPFPFKANVKAFTLSLADSKFVFFPDCVYMIRDSDCEALFYESIKWTIGMTQIPELSAPEDSQIVGETWRYVNKKGGPDRRFSYNPTLSQCLYGEVSLNFANRRCAKLLLSSTNVSRRMIEIKTTSQSSTSWQTKD